jgi:hypothetical protein
VKAPSKTHHHIGQAVSLKGLRAEVGKVNGFNSKVAVILTRGVGTMWCAYLFLVIALLGLRPALKPGGEGIIAWIAQTMLQLVLLSVIMVGSNVQAMAADARSQHTYDDTVDILNALNTKTDGGLKDVLDAVNALKPAPKRALRTALKK